jgi:hypothetical protein
MTEGVTRVVHLATEINDIIGSQRIQFIDIGACAVQSPHEGCRSLLCYSWMYYLFYPLLSITMLVRTNPDHRLFCPILTHSLSLSLSVCLTPLHFTPLSPYSRQHHTPLTSPSLTAFPSHPHTGGGLSVNYSSDAVTPTFNEYSKALRAACPQLFNRPLQDGPAQRLTVITGMY